MLAPVVAAVAWAAWIIAVESGKEELAVAGCDLPEGGGKEEPAATHQRDGGGKEELAVAGCDSPEGGGKEDRP